MKLEKINSVLELRQGDTVLVHNNDNDPTLRGYMLYDMLDGPKLINTESKLDHIIVRMNILRYRLWSTGPLMMDEPAYIQSVEWSDGRDCYYRVDPQFMADIKSKEHLLDTMYLNAMESLRTQFKENIEESIKESRNDTEEKN